MRQLATPNWGRNYFPHYPKTHLNNIFISQETIIFLNDRIDYLLVLIIEPILSIKPISLEHVSV